MGNGEKVKVKPQGDLFLQAATTGEVVKIQTFICPEFLKDILSTKQLLKQGHSVKPWIRQDNTLQQMTLTQRTDWLRK